MNNDDDTRVKRALGAIGDAALPPPHFDGLRLNEVSAPPRRLHPVRNATVALVGIAAIIGAVMFVANDDEPDSLDAGQANETTTTLENPNASGAITAFECPPGADCIRGFQVNGEHYEATCVGVKPDLVTETVVARGAIANWTELRTITDVDRGVMLAVTGSGCAETTDEWTAVLPPTSYPKDAAGALLLARAKCNAFITPEPICAQGGGGRWSGDDPYTEGYVYFDEYIDAVNDANSSPEAWRTDLDEVVRRYLLEERQWCASPIYPFCRVAVSAVPDETATVVDLEGVFQTSYPMVDNEPDMTEEEVAALPEQPAYETYPFSVRAERLRDGGTWWVTRYQEQTSIRHGFNEEGRAAADAAATCCPTIVTERIP